MADMQTTIKMQARGVLTLPKKLRTRMRLDTGAIVNVDEREGGICISTRPQMDHALMESVRAALEDVRLGRTIGPFSSMKEYAAFRKARKAIKLGKA